MPPPMSASKAADPVVILGVSSRSILTSRPERKVIALAVGSAVRAVDCKNLTRSAEKPLIVESSRVDAEATRPTVV